MDLIAPLGPVYQAGTLSGNPLAMRAGLASLAKLNGDAFSVSAAHTDQDVDCTVAAARESLKEASKS